MDNETEKEMIAATIDPDGHVNYGEARCYSCNNGWRHPMMDCPKCDGTGRGIRGGRGGCKQCHGLKRIHDMGAWIDCGHCHGTGVVAEDRYNTLPRSGPVRAALAARPIVVVRQQRNASFNEMYIGAGRVTSVIDYGRMAKLDDVAVAAIIREDLESARTMQYCAVVDDDDYLASHILVIITHDGYSVKAIFDEAATTSAADRTAREATPDQAHDGRSTWDIITEARK